MTYAELDRRADEPAAALEPRLPEGTARLGLLCRNGREFVVALVAVVAVVAVTRLGAGVVLLNREYVPSELAAVLVSERVDLVLLDGDDLPAPPPGFPVLDLRSPVPARAAGTGIGRGARPGRGGQVVVLTSGTTGPAKGARHDRNRLGQSIPVTTLVRWIPLRAGTPMILTPPLSHGFGLGFLALGLALVLPVVVRRRPDVEQVRDVMAARPGCVLVGVPAVLARIERVTGAARLSAVVSGAGLLPPSVAARLTASYGPVLFDLYGSSEEGWSTLATPVVADDVVSAASPTRSSAPGSRPASSRWTASATTGSSRRSTPTRGATSRGSRCRGSSRSSQLSR